MKTVHFVIALVAVAAGLSACSNEPDVAELWQQQQKEKARLAAIPASGKALSAQQANLQK